MILIAGAGISGLSLAFFLKEKGIDFLLIDPAVRAGGKICTLQKDGFLLDAGPNTLLADEEVLRFLEAVGLSEEIQFPGALSQKRFIFRNGRFHGLSQHPLSLFFSELLSWKGKFRILKERWIPGAADSDEDLASFVCRRFGSEALDWLANPVQYGIHAADPEKLLVADAFPALHKMEKDYGSVLKGLADSGSAARAKTLNFRGGMQVLSERLAEKAGEKIRLQCRLQSLERSGSGWNCLMEFPDGCRSQHFESVIFCMPAPQAAEILLKSGISSASSLAAVRYNPMTVAHMAFSKKPKPEFRGFGGLVPAAAGFRSAGAIWTSALFPDRQPEGYHLLTAFYGGALRQEAAKKTKEETEQELQAENAVLYGRMADFILHIHQWSQAIPQYDASRREAEKAIAGLRSENLYFLANWKGGIGLSDCIRQASVLSKELR